MVVVIDVVKASLARLLLIVHAFVAVWRVVEYKGSMYYWLLLLPLLGLVIDTAYILFKRKGVEWKWFSPSIFFYLGATLPAIWWLELGRLYEKQDHKSNWDSSQNSSTGVDLFNELNAYLTLGSNEWTMFVEQAMLLVLIISRWLMPLKKNHMTRDQLSQLLLVYLGLAADIVELLAIFDEPGIIDYTYFTFAILASWSWSLMQFTLVLTATRGRAFKTGRKVHDGEGSEAEGEPEVEEKTSSDGCFCCENETWSILVMLLMLDAPFLVLRLLAMTLFKINTYTIYFFTCKNMLVVLLQMYRLIIVCANHRREMKDQQKRACKQNDGSEIGRKLARSRGEEDEESNVRSRSYRLTRVR